MIGFYSEEIDLSIISIAVYRLAEMPVLLAILAYLVCTALTMEGRNEALAKIFIPDFSKLSDEGFLEALGHAFFTLSLGLGVQT